MKLSDYKATYRDYSAKASDNLRYVAFAGIGIIWLFHGGGDKEIAFPARLPAGLLKPLLFFVAGISFDILQYVLATLIWKYYFRKLERKAKRSGAGRDTEYKHSPWLPAPIDFCFYSKMATVVCGYVFLAAFLWDSISWT